MRKRKSLILHLFLISSTSDRLAEIVATTWCGAVGNGDDDDGDNGDHVVDKVDGDADVDSYVVDNVAGDVDDYSGEG